MKIKSFLGGYDKNFCYLVWCEKTKYAAVIDASVKPDKIISFIENQNLIINKIFITHSHGDHIFYINDWINFSPNISIYGYDIKTKNFNTNSINISNNEVINIGKELITSIHTPGHYYDSICYWNQFNKSIFTGDTIFVGRTGRTLSHRSNVSDLYNSVYNILFKLPEETIIFPGHHYGHVENITFKENRKYSNFFNCKSESEFITIMENFEKNR